MTFDEVLDQVIEMLQRRGRVSYRALKRQFDLDDAYLADLKAEIIEVHRLAVDQDGTMLVWTGAATTPSQSPAASPSPGHPWRHRTTPGARPNRYQPRSQRLTPNAASSRCCSATWWTPRAWPASSIPKTTAPWYAPTSRPVPRSSSPLTAISPSISAMVCWSTSAIPRPMTTMHNGQYAQGSASSTPCGRSVRVWCRTQACALPSDLASTPGWWWWAPWAEGQAGTVGAGGHTQHCSAPPGAGGTGHAGAQCRDTPIGAGLL